MNFIFLVSRYPTEKAYGVTTLNTTNELRKLGHNVEVWSNSFSGKDYFGTEIKNVRFPLTSKFDSILPSKFIFFPVLVNVNNAARLINVLMKEKPAPDSTFVVRDIIQAYILLKYSKSYRIILDIHHPPKRLVMKFFLRSFSKFEQITVLTISMRNYREITKYSRNLKIQIVPMGVSEKFFHPVRNLALEKNCLVLGFVGKESSSGNDNGLLEFLSFCLNASAKIDSKLTIKLVGLTQSFHTEISRLFPANSKFKVECAEHLLHSEIPKILETFDVGFIPYPPTSYNKNRFPIKALEYAAAGIPILVRENSAYKDLFPVDSVHFYSSQEDLISQLRSFESSFDSSVPFSENAQIWARSHLYSERAARICVSVENNKV